MPSIAMMIFTSIYGIVDGFFVSNFAGDIPFKAVNLIMPFLMILGTVGFMFGTGGTAIVAKTSHAKISVASMLMEPMSSHRAVNISRGVPIAAIFHRSRKGMASSKIPAGMT